MRRIRISVFWLLLTLSTACTSISSNKPSDIKEPYLGQKPPGLIPALFAPGIVSTDNLEAQAGFSPDLKEFYFLRQVEGEKSQTHVIQYVDGAWQESVFGPAAGVVFISPDGNTMHLKNKYRERTASGWSNDKSLGPLFEEIPVMRLTASAANTFVFDEQEKIGTIRQSRLIDGNREKPKALGKAINTGMWTAHPFIAPDESYLIWDSEREGGYGDTDLYISFRQDDGSWGSAINMGEEINTEYGDSHGSVTQDGKYFFFQTLHIGEDWASSFANIFWVDAQVIENLRQR